MGRRRVKKPTRHNVLTAQRMRMRKQGYVPVKEAADLAGVGLSTMYEWLERKAVTGKRIGRARYVSKASLQDYIGLAGKQ